MKRLIYSLAILSILLFACNISATSTPTAVTVPPVVTVPTDVTVPTVVTVTTDVTVPTVVTVSPPVNTVPPPVVTEPPITTNVTCYELKFYLDPALASSTKCETVPEVPEGIMVNPQYTKLTLQGYILSGKFWDAQISVFPVQRYTELLPDFMPGNVTALQNLIGGAMPDFSAASFGFSLPFLPTINAGQVFQAQYQAVAFVSGGGIRYLTLLAQDFAVINNHELFYTYQGLTSDGQYWVSAILPITTPILPENSDTLPGGQTYDQFTSNYTAYITGITTQLNSQTSDSYTPTLAALDALVSSITIQP